MAGPKAGLFEYVKVCSLYGAGFYYMPGTDICIKIGGYVRAQYYAGWGGTSGTHNAWTGTASSDNRSNTGQDYIFRTRALVSFDTRQQTEYGTLRTYMNLGYTHDTAGTSSIYVNRGFIQLAGFTFGKAQSFFDIFSTASVSYFAWPSSDTGDGGTLVASYTAQFGNGFTGTISLEDARRTSVVNTANDTYAVGVLPTNSYGNHNIPDVVANLRVDQAWGSAQVMGAIHQVRANWYGTDESAGHPEDEYGWVIGAGVRLKADAISRGDVFQAQFSYTEGALRYLANTQFGYSYGRYTGSEVGIGWVMDGIYTTNGNIELTKGWAVTASYDHLWNQRWKTSVYGGYLDVQYNDTASAYVCSGLVYTGGCSADWSTWWVGSRTQFNINASTYLGVDVLYTKLNTMSEGSTVGLGAANGHAAGTYALKDQDNLGVTFRIHRDFLP